MKTQSFWTVAACGALTLTAFSANAQTVVVEEEAVVTEVPCKTHYYSNAGDNWFIQVGAGVSMPIEENWATKGNDDKRHFTTDYNVGFGKWVSPYWGARLSFQGGALHWNQGPMARNKWVNANADIMWDMFNSLGGVNSGRFFSVVPFVGLGGAFTWDYKPEGTVNVMDSDGSPRINSWALPVSAGIQLRMRLCKYVDFFAEGRAMFAGDNFNNYVGGKPIDMNLNVLGGFSFNLGGAGFKEYNPCDYLGYINNLNNQVNDLRGALATTAAALAVAESQLPCPEVPAAQPATVVEESAPLMSTVRFTINSATISDEEMVNVYNVAQWMKANPEEKVAIVGYADKNTGTADYNMGLSKRRAEAVKNVLVNNYGINPDRLAVDAEGSATQPYTTNNWNRIVIFNAQ